MDNNENILEESDSIEKTPIKKQTNRGKTQAQTDNLAKGRLVRQANIKKKYELKVLDAKKTIVQDDPDYKDLQEFKESKSKQTIKPVEDEPEVIYVKKQRKKVVIVQESESEDEEPDVKPKRAMKSQQNKKSIIKIQETPAAKGEQCYFE